MEIFILGILFALVVIPLADGLTSVILSLFELIRSYFAVKIAKCNYKIQNPVVEEPTRKIGFVMSEEEMEVED